MVYLWRLETAHSRRRSRAGPHLYPAADDVEGVFQEGGEGARAGAHAALTVLSGPAGGVGGALLLAELSHEPSVLCFDMGGTSCDVCVVDEL